VTRLDGVGPKRTESLARLGVRTIADLLAHFPRGYEDRRTIARVADAVEGERITLRVRVVDARLVRLRGRLNMAEVTIEDDSGRMRATWFNQGYLARTLKSGTALVLTGLIGKYKGPALKNPELEILSGDELDSLHVGRLVPMYPMTEGLSQRVFREWVWRALETGAQPADALPQHTRDQYGFADRAESLRAVHFPESIDSAESARKLFAFEELLVLQSLVLRQRGENASRRGISHSVDGAHLAALRKSLPFRPTGGQSAAIDEILADMASPRPMARLLQGDVGCGKTMVALHAIASCVDGGYQAALMAPTEVLAAQHYRTLLAGLEPLGMRVALLTGSSPKDVRAEIRSGDAHVVVGTHALFEDATEFRLLGLAIVDEQHRFGVGQRERLAAKGADPDRLHLTATPIPRSVAMTLYGAMDLTMIRELPPGRLPVKTSVVRPGREREVWAAVRDQVELGFQAYVVCPNVESSEKRKLADAHSRFEALSQGAFGGLRCALVHGRLESEEKDRLLEDFRAGRIDVLVSTTVIEVGVDAPRAAVIAVEDAGSFGLTQLHQLRGRVGRSGHPSYCFLLGKPASGEAARRLEILCETNDGFRIAEEDFALRGPGEIHGERQSGLSDLKAARLPRDMELLLEARRAAEAIFAADPELADPDHAALAQAVMRAQQIAV
jgi:ATP-dependent DNA helicase RecG